MVKQRMWEDPRVIEYRAGGSYDRVLVADRATAETLLNEYAEQVTLKWLPEAAYGRDGLFEFQVR